MWFIFQSLAVYSQTGLCQEHVLKCLQYVIDSCIFVILFQEAFDMYQMFHMRHALHRKAYQHKTTHAIEIMSVWQWQDTSSKYNYEGLGGWEGGSSFCHCPRVSLYTLCLRLCSSSDENNSFLCKMETQGYQSFSVQALFVWNNFPAPICHCVFFSHSSKLLLKPFSLLLPT